MAERRLMKQLTPQLPQPDLQTLKKVVFRPSDPKNRGDLEFACPKCKRVLLDEVAEHYIPSAPPIFCGTCKVWVSPSGKDFRSRGSESGTGS